VRLTIERARQIAIMAQLLAADRPTDLLGVIRHLGFLQIDVTAAVARTEHLVAWSRLGRRYEQHDLARLLADGLVFEHRAFIRPIEDYPLLRAEMDAWPEGDGSWAREVRRFLAENDAFRRYVLDELERRGPLRSRDIEDRAALEWRSRGWTNRRNTVQLLDYLSGQGVIATSGRAGQERLWDLAERVHPTTLPRIPIEEARRERARRRLLALGIVRVRSPEDVGDLGVVAEVEGLRGRWRVEPELLDRSFVGRAALLSPFDRLVYNRGVTLALFDFEYKLEMYVPVPDRRWGYFVLPALHGDRLVAKVDARADRAAGVLRVPALHLESHAAAGDEAAVGAELNELAAWLRIDRVEVERVARES
jgi:hypothetical protein